jgi:ring-1,2-phenylacetyl-CoA epoxidase subunit PaaD
MNTQQIYDILSEVTDPEIPVITIAELGLLQTINVSPDGTIKVYITPTYTGCPAMDMITVHIKGTLQDYGYQNVEVITVLDPPWSTDMITEAGRQKLLEYGISPPAQRTSDLSFINGEAPIVVCPQCGSKETEIISRFGSTPCKSLYKCHSCLEPFDYFKCH